jgi:hypothetical protein
VSLLDELTEVWRSKSACLGTGPDLFYNERGQLDYTAALELCAICRVRTECLNYALRCEPVIHGHRLGVWGGLLPIERKRLAASLGRIRQCSECGETFQTTSSTAATCCGACAKARDLRRRRKLYAESVAL